MLPIIIVNDMSNKLVHWPLLRLVQ